MVKLNPSNDISELGGVTI